MPRKLSRRQFTAAAAASALTFNYIPSRVFGANERLLVAGIGVGGKGRGEVNDVSRAGGKFVALCDVDHSRAGGTFKNYPDAKVYKDFRVMLEKEKGIDAVTVSTPDHMHAPASIAAMQLGKHVYCQKPLTHTVHEARVMTKLARDMKLATQMGNQAHAGEPIRRAVELVQAGIIGDVTEAHCWTNRPIWPQGMSSRPPKQDIPDTLDWDLWLGPAPQRDFNSAYLPFKWRGWWDFGTGALGDMACHIMDMAFWALDLRYPEFVMAQQGGNTAESPPNWSTVTWLFPPRTVERNGKPVKLPGVKFVWYDGKKDGQQNYPSKAVVEQDGIPHRRIREFGTVLVGTKGKMFFNRGKTNWIVTPNERLEQFANTPKTIRRVPNEDAEWVEACKGGPAALSAFDYSGPLSEAVLLGNVAIRTGKGLRFDGPNLKITNDEAANAMLTKPYRSGWGLGVSKV